MLIDNVDRSKVKSTVKIFFEATVERITVS